MSDHFEDEDCLDFEAIHGLGGEPPTTPLPTVPVSPEDAWMEQMLDLLCLKRAILHKEAAEKEHCFCVAKEARDAAKRELGFCDYTMQNLQDLLDFARKRACGSS